VSKNGIFWENSSKIIAVSRDPTPEPPFTSGVWESAPIVWGK